MRIYYTATNNGDGSSSVIFFDSQECIDVLEEEDPETYGSGEGGAYFNVIGEIDAPVYTMKDVKEWINERSY